MLFVGCSSSKDDPKPGPEPEPGTETPLPVLKHVFDTFKEQSLWSATMPDKIQDGKEINKYEPNEYFNRFLRYQNDGAGPAGGNYFGDRFSGVYEIDATRGALFSNDHTYGHGFFITYVPKTSGTNPAIHQLLISYVVPGSPAYNAGLRRGDLVTELNGSASFTLQDLMGALGKPTIKFGIIYPVAREVEFTAESFLDTPIVHHSIIEAGGKKAGYLVYNSFVSGENDIFISELIDVFTEFKNAGVSDLILDLRYNGGGEVYAADFLTGLSVDQSALDKAYLYLEDAKSMGIPSQFTGYKLRTNEELGGANLNPNNVYIITSGGSASASELVLHCLQGVMGKSRVIQVGERSLGKNVGGYYYEGTTYPWDLNVIAFRVHNVHKESGYELGIVPDAENIYGIKEGDPGDAFFGSLNGVAYLVFGGFGDPEMERYLNHVVQYVFPGEFPKMPAFDEGATRAPSHLGKPVFVNTQEYDGMLITTPEELDEKMKRE